MRVSGRASTGPYGHIAGPTVGLTETLRKTPIFSVKLPGTPKSGHWLSAAGCPLCATNGRVARSLMTQSK